MDELTLNTIKVILPTTIAFFAGMALTPLLTHYLYKYKMWKKKSVTKATDGRDAPITAKLHGDEERKTPRMGGVLVWSVTFLTIIFFSLYAMIDGEIASKLSFLSRNQTWLPLFTLIVGGLIGLVDDWFVVSDRIDYFAGGMSLFKRLTIVFLVSIIGAWWFYVKLDTANIVIPFVGEWNMGFYFIPFFMLVMISTYSGGVIDGIDGLSGGIFSIIFSAYGIIALSQNQIDLSTFCFKIVGSILAFLWFNIPPARFFLSDTGTMSLTLTLTVVAFLTEQVVVLPIIALPLVLASGSSSLQLLSKKFRHGKKIFLVAPIHHHFQAVGWPAYKVTMRFWVIGIVFALLGVVIALIG